MAKCQQSLFLIRVVWNWNFLEQTQVHFFFHNFRGNYKSNFFAKNRLRTIGFFFSARINCVSTLFILRWRWKKLYEIDFFLSTNKVLIKKTFCERFFKIIFCENTPNTVILLSQLCSGCFALSDQWNLHLLMFLSKKYCFIHNPIIWKKNWGRKQFRTSTGNSWVQLPRQIMT